MNAWIERRVFPGAYPPSLMEMMQIFEPNKLSILDVENLRLHYSLTLQHWLERYEAHSDEVLALMDESFVKTWRLYLAGSIAAFNVGELQLFQVVFSRARNNQIPWSRNHLYVDKPAITSKQHERSLAEA
jgi:cyclopropane-fatty-acyl-phospholipid synthase